ncbi:hypothetical protein JTE90_020268 [Oedothorax gibbosus]|uniref:Eukaryotic translation initiation factor 2-alpha kinase 1 n=1 Tax=Oedothorax gibbosus TaxID=931172 RepID=A0AAV6VPT2_9ARAC|nr:hypothetical protein JTE90_020268 [Oedothorax gibbosus]
MPKFSKDKETLLKILKRFDGDFTVEDITDTEEFKKESSNHTFLLHIVLEALCGIVEKDAEKRLQLFNGVYSVLSKSDVLDEKIVLDNLMPTRRKMAFNLLKMITKIHNTVVPNPTQDIKCLDYIKTSEFVKYQDKYKETFDEIKVIAEGGFGTVYMARHKFDGIIYAVKKIIFKLKNDSEYSQVIREVRSISALNHLNVVSYNNAWIEGNSSQSEISSEASSSTENSELGSLNSNVRSNRKKPKCASALQFSKSTSSSTTQSGSSNSKLNEFSEDIIFSKLENANFSQVSLNSRLRNKFFQSSGLSEVSESSSSEADSFQWNSSNISNATSKIDEGNILPSFKNLSFMCPKVMLCIQMEFCDCDLRLWLDQRAKGEPLPFQMDELGIFKDILHGVAHIHLKSIIHRDLKPQNIFYSTKDNVMKIGDFGLATLGSSSPNRHKDVSTHHSSDLGTLPYAAPEQRNGNNYSNKVDIYSLGIILIELLLQFQTHMEFCKTIESISKSDIPKKLLEKWPDYVFLVENLIEKNPSSRMSAKEILILPLIHGQDNHEELQEKLLDKDRLLEEKDGIIEEKDGIIEEKDGIIEEKDGIIERLMQKNKELTIINTQLREQIKLSQQTS